MAEPEKKRLTRVVAFRLPEDEYHLFIGKARAAGQSQTEFFRSAVLQNKTEVLAHGVPLTEDELKRLAEAEERQKRLDSARKKTSDEKKQLLFLFNKASNNLNQLAKAANTALLAGTADKATFESILEDLNHLTQYFRASIDHVD